jgi:hypothetical protein
MLPWILELNAFGIFPFSYFPVLSRILLEIMFDVGEKEKGEEIPQKLLNQSLPITWL